MSRNKNEAIIEKQGGLVTSALRVPGIPGKVTAKCCTANLEITRGGITLKYS